MSGSHTIQGVTEGVHIAYQWAFADSTARALATDPRTGAGYQTKDLYKFARQTDDNSIWMLTALTPTWQKVGGGAGSTTPTAVEGNVLIGDSSPEWVLLDASADTKILVGNGTTLTSVALSGDVTMTNAGVVTIANDAVTLAKLANVTRGSLIVGGASDAPTLLSGKTLGAILIGDGTDITSTVNPSIAGTVTSAGLDVTDGTYHTQFLPQSSASSGLLAGITFGSYSTAGVLNIGGGFYGGDTSSGVNMVSYQSGGWKRVLSYVNAGSLFIMPDYGNVLIGTTTDISGAKLQVAGNLVVSNGTSALFTVDGSTYANYVVLDAAATNSLDINNSSGDTRILGTNIKLRVTGADPAVSVLSGGNVGINETTIPTGAKLAVGGGIAVTDGAGTVKASLYNNQLRLLNSYTRTAQKNWAASASTIDILTYFTTVDLATTDTATIRVTRVPTTADSYEIFEGVATHRYTGGSHTFFAEFTRLGGSVTGSAITMAFASGTGVLTISNPESYRNLMISVTSNTNPTAWHI